MSGFALRVFSDSNGPFFFVRDYRGHVFGLGGSGPVKRFETIEEAREAGAKETPWQFTVVDYDEASNIDFLKDHLNHV